MSGANTYSGGTLVSAGTLQGSTTSLQGGIVNEAEVRFDQPGNGVFGGTISGRGSVTKAGGGTVTFGGANSYSGATTVAGGTLRAGSVNAFGASSATTVAGGASLDLNGFSQTLGSLGGAGIVTLGNAVLVTGGNDAEYFVYGKHQRRRRHREDGRRYLHLDRISTATAEERWSRGGRCRATRPACRVPSSTTPRWSSTRLAPGRTRAA